MKKFLPWLKSHWLIVLLGVIAITALPVASYFAADMNASLTKKFQDDVNKDFDSVAIAKAKISYSIPGVDGGKVLEKSGEANEAMINAYRDIWAQVQGKTGGVSEKGLTFNKGQHKLLIDDFFPAPKEDSEPVRQVRGREFIRRLIAFHADLLKNARAGMPTSPEVVGQLLNEQSQAFIDKVKAETGRDLDAAEKDKLAKELQDSRIGIYRKRAAEISFYADVSAFEGIPTEVPNKAPSLPTAWDLQERAWVNQDIVAAIVHANGESAAGVPDSVVKRLVHVQVRPPSWDVNNPQPAAFEPGEDKAPLNFNISVSGRTSGPGSKNKWFDLRYASVEAVVSAQRFPQFVDALAATNFMTIVDLDVVRVEPLSDLREGFYYGDEPVVRVTALIETVWLRDWRKDAMPADVQKALGMVEGVSGASDAAPAPTPPPRPNRPPPGGPAGKPGGGKAGGGKPGHGADD